MALPTFHELLSLGIKTYGDADSESTDGICKQLLTKVRSFLLWSAYAATLGRFAAPLDETAVSPNQARF